MRILHGKTNIDFLGKRRVALFVSTALNLSVLVALAVGGLNLGVDFVGGTLVEVKFEQPMNAEQVRAAAAKGGLRDPQVQGIGAASEHSFLLRVGGTTQLTPAAAKVAVDLLRARGASRVQAPNLDDGVIAFRMPAAIDTLALKQALELATGIEINQVLANGEAPMGGLDYQAVAGGMAASIRRALDTGTGGQAFEMPRVDYVGPQVGKQLRNKGLVAVLFATLALLVYVAFRFDFKFAPGVLVGLVHDLVMVLGYFVVTRREFNLTSIAVLLTALGYSINDRIVVYDRIREEMARFKGKPLAEVINIAINATLSRTLLTSGVTALSLTGLLVFASGELFDFSAAMLVGIVVGTYSSIYIASPLTLWMDARASRTLRKASS